MLDTWFSSQLWPFSVFGWPERHRGHEALLPDGRPRHRVRHPVLLGGADDHGGPAVHRARRRSRPFTSMASCGSAARRCRRRRATSSIPSRRSPSSAPTPCGSPWPPRLPRGPTVSVERGRMAQLAELRDQALERGAVHPGAARGPGRRRRRSRPAATSRCRTAGSCRGSRRRPPTSNRHLEAFRFDEAAGAIYAFLWHELCDGYLEMVKPVLSRAAIPTKPRAARGVLRRCLEGSVALLHPFMPFLTEEIWEKLTGKPGTLIVPPYPQGDGPLATRRPRPPSRPSAGVVTRVRTFRTERGASPTERRRADDRSGLARPRAALPCSKTLSPLLIHLARLGPALRPAGAGSVPGRRGRPRARAHAAAAQSAGRGRAGREDRRGGRRRDRCSSRPSSRTRTSSRRLRGRSSRRCVPVSSSSKRSGRRSRDRDHLSRTARSTRTAGAFSRTASASIAFPRPTRSPATSSTSTSRRIRTCVPTVLAAEVQPGAYGRNGRSWAAPAGRASI